MEKELLEIIEQIRDLEDDNIEIEEKLQHLIADKNKYQEKKDSSNYLDDRLVATGIANVYVVGLIAYLYKINHYSSWEANEIISLLVPLVSDTIFSSCLLHSYFKDKKAKQPQEKIDYSKLVDELDQQIITLQNTHSQNLDTIQSLNNQVLEFKHLISVSCSESIATNEDDDMYVSEPPVKTIGAYK